MVEIGGIPIIQHILSHYGAYGFDEFVICCGYKGYIIKEYFCNYFIHSSDLTVDLRNGDIDIHRKHAPPWKVTLVDTGQDTNTGGRLRRVGSYLNGERFMFTYGDGLSDVDITELQRSHEKSGLKATMTAVNPPGRFGAISLDTNGTVTSFSEKTDNSNTLINGGFFVLENSVIDHITSDHSSFEHDILPKLSASNDLNAYKHSGFWSPMDTLRDKNYLEQLWSSGTPPWKR